MEQMLANRSNIYMCTCISCETCVLKYGTSYVSIDLTGRSTSGFLRTVFFRQGNIQLITLSIVQHRADHEYVVSEVQRITIRFQLYQIKGSYFWQN